MPQQIFPEPPYTLGSGDRLRIVCSARKGSRVLISSTTPRLRRHAADPSRAGTGMTTQQLAGAYRGAVTARFHTRARASRLTSKSDRPIFHSRRGVSSLANIRLWRNNRRNDGGDCRRLHAARQKSMVDLTRPLRPQRCARRCRSTHRCVPATQFMSPSDGSRLSRHCEPEPATHRSPKAGDPSSDFSLDAPPSRA